MTFLIYISGIITGMIAALTLIFAALRFKTPIQRTFNQTQSKLTEKGKILEPEDEQLKDWMDSLKTQ